jgi:DNA polymerase I-like protein with 3'-5' exonuclease and polymerase domains
MNNNVWKCDITELFKNIQNVQNESNNDLKQFYNKENMNDKTKYKRILFRDLVYSETDPEDARFLCVSSYAERLARRATHEGSVSDVGRRALLDADRALRTQRLKAQPVLQILDEVLFEVPEDELQRAAKVASEAMRNAFVLEVPLVVGVEAGKNWADLEPVKLLP